MLPCGIPLITFIHDENLLLILTLTIMITISCSHGVNRLRRSAASLCQYVESRSLKLNPPCNNTNNLAHSKLHINNALNHFVAHRPSTSPQTAGTALQCTVYATHVDPQREWLRFSDHYASTRNSGCTQCTAEWWLTGNGHWHINKNRWRTHRTICVKCELSSTFSALCKFSGK